MALISCKECKAQISDQAKQCPKCGAPVIEDVSPPKKKKGCLIAALVILAVPLGLVVVGTIVSERDKASITPEQRQRHQAAQAEAIKDSDARNVCTDFVRAALKAPSTAKFQSTDEYVVVRHSDGSYLVGGYVDAQNAFGAMLRQTFACTVIPGEVASNGQRNWRLAIPIAFGK